MHFCVAIDVHHFPSARYIDHNDNFLVSVRLNRTPLSIHPLDPAIATREFGGKHNTDSQGGLLLLLLMPGNQIEEPFVGAFAYKRWI